MVPKRRQVGEPEPTELSHVTGRPEGLPPRLDIEKPRDWGVVLYTPQTFRVAKPDGSFLLPWIDSTPRRFVYQVRQEF